MKLYNNLVDPYWMILNWFAKISSISYKEAGCVRLWVCVLIGQPSYTDKLSPLHHVIINQYITQICRVALEKTL